MKPLRPSKGDFEAFVARTIRCLDYFLPETEAAVRASDSQVSEATPLPPELQDPYAVFEPRKRVSNARSEADDEGVTDELHGLARAARNGQHAIPPEIEALMHRDREAAEQAMTNQEDNDDDAAQ